jgi:hypothetical protein
LLEVRLERRFWLADYSVDGSGGELVRLGTLKVEIEVIVVGNVLSKESGN